MICHGIPTQTLRLQEGDIVNIDITTILDSYYGDTSRMIAIGEIGENAEDIIDVARTSLLLGIEVVKPGNKFSEIARVITNYAERQGCSVVNQFCGHGTGIEFHEEPQINHFYNKTMDHRKMQPNMIFTIEPMINEGKQRGLIDLEDKWTARTIDGKLSAQYEHTLLVTDVGVEVLTQTCSQTS